MSIRVAVIDSGVDWAHPDLRNVKVTDDLSVRIEDGFLCQEEFPVSPGRELGACGTGDQFGHGTAVVGILQRTADTLGVDIEVGAFQALDHRNQARSQAIAACARQAIARGYEVINCSFGCRGLDRYVGIYKEWVDEAFLAGVTVVAAGSNIDEDRREWPSHFTSVIGVGGIACKTTELFHKKGKMISFFAAGEDLEVPWLGGARKRVSGCSFAAPNVAARAAAIRAELADPDADTVRLSLRNQATALPGE